MRFLLCALGLLLAASACAPPPGSPLATPIAVHAETQGGSADSEVAAEAARLRSSLKLEVPGLLADTPQTENGWVVRTKAAISASSFSIQRPQLLVVVDRNPAVQQIRIVLARPEGPWESLGGTDVSTGQAGRRDYYITPTGVFLHTDAILDWRAEGTFNAQHIRGLGLKGMRVWDFGWQLAERGWGPNGEKSEIRLLLHATDPDYLEQRLGRAASKGCVRIPGAMNRFLDRHGVLDADYERAAKEDSRFRDLMLSDRTPTPLAGNALVVIDSSQPSNPISMSAPMPLMRRAHEPVAQQSCG
jgi:lipoprotein-anchoring transpeptidase ErfK/SrfK